MVGGTSLLNEVAVKCVVLGLCLLTSKRIFNLLEG